MDKINFGYLSLYNGLSELDNLAKLDIFIQEELEELKKVFEGLPTQVNVKNRPPQMLERTPVILTTNTEPWKFFSAERAPLMNRMFIYTVRQPSEVLAKVQKGPDTRFYGTVFEYIRKEVESRPVWPVPPQSPEMKIMQAKVEDFVKRLACNQEDRFVEGIVQGTLLKRGNLVRSIMFCNKPQSERWRLGLQSMMMVLRNDDENEKIDYVNGYLQCQYRRS